MYLHLCIYLSGTGNRLASTLYEVDPEVEAEIEKASQKPGTSAGSKGTTVLQQHTAGNDSLNRMSILFECSLNAL